MRPSFLPAPPAKHSLPDKGNSHAVKTQMLESPKYEEYIIRASIHKGNFSSCLEKQAKNMVVAVQQGTVRRKEHRDMFLGDKMA